MSGQKALPEKSREREREPEEDDEPKKPPHGMAVGVWGLVLFLGCRLLEIFLEAQATASAVGQAVLVEWGSSRLGVAWSDPAKEQTPARLVRRAGVGAGVGLAAALVLVALLALTHGALFEPVPAVAWSVLVIGFVTAGLHAWRDELLHHGVVLRALGLFDKGDASGKPHDLIRALACGVTSAGVALGRSGASAEGVIVAGLLGIVFGALWVRDRGAWMAWGAHTVFRFTLETLLAGGLTQIRLAADRWAGGDAGIFGGSAAVTALAPVALLAIALIVRRISPDPARVG